MANLLHSSHIAASVRAFLWAFGSPAVVTSTDDNRWQTDEWCSWRALELAGITVNASLSATLSDFLASEKDHRLGARFERLIEFGLSQLPGFESVNRRLQVQHDGRTLGEFDFLVRELSSGALEHWEVASKFYLGVPVDDSLAWVGPGKRDSLIRKLHHLNRKQLKLSTLPEAKSALSELDASPSQVRALVKGRLFYPLAWPETFDRRFRFGTSLGEVTLNERAPSGYWCDLNQFVEASPECVFPLEKHQWLDPEPEYESTLTQVALEKRLAEGPQCVDVKTRDGVSQRWFVVAPGWFDDLDTESLV